MPRELVEPVLPRLAVERLVALRPLLAFAPVELRELDEALDLPELLARLVPDLVPPELARFVAPLDRELAGFDPAGFDLADFDAVDLDRELPDLVPVDFFAVDRPLLARAPPEPDLLEPLPDEPASSFHLPDITRCAASATASAISEPSRVALDIAALAALLAVSAASRPASRILRRAAGLALIAAAAAARPAASISRLIAAFAILSTVLSPEPDEPEELFFLLDFAMAGLPLSQERHLRAVTVP